MSDPTDSEQRNLAKALHPELLRLNTLTTSIPAAAPHIVRAMKLVNDVLATPAVDQGSWVAGEHVGGCNDACHDDQHYLLGS